MGRSELFGHVKGAYTDAIADKAGWIEIADGGCLILEEIGELSNECQAQLLTLIEDGKFHRVGDNKIREVKNISIVGATNRKKSELREDFWNRFMIFNIPPLYQRRQDILYYIEEKEPDLIKLLEPWETLVLLAHNWPGNVREIDKVILSIQSLYHLVSIYPSIKELSFPTFFSQFPPSSLGTIDEDNSNLSLIKVLS